MSTNLSQSVRASVLRESQISGLLDETDGGHGLRTAFPDGRPEVGLMNGYYRSGANWDTSSKVHDGKCVL